MNHSHRVDFQQPHSMFGTWVGVVLLFAVFGLFVWVVFSAMPHGNTYEAKRAQARMEKLEQLQKDATVALTSYAWVDKKKGTVRIPIEQAMQLELADLAAKKPTAAYPIATPAPSTAPAAQTGAPAPSVLPTAAPAARANPTPKPISPEAGLPLPTPVQSPPGKHLPVRGKSPKP